MQICTACSVREVICNLVICVTDMLQISTAELAAKAEETRGQLRHLDQQVGLIEYVVIFVCGDRERNRSEREVGTGKYKPYGHASMSGIRHVTGSREVVKKIRGGNPDQQCCLIMCYLHQDLTDLLCLVSSILKYHIWMFYGLWRSITPLEINCLHTHTHTVCRAVSHGFDWRVTKLTLDFWQVRRSVCFLLLSPSLWNDQKKKQEIRGGERTERRKGRG